MRKVIAAINMTVNGNCDHTAGIPDKEIHEHYTALLEQGGTILYGRTTYQLMEYWRGFLENPSDDEAMNNFAEAIDKIPKIVFSHTLKNVDWESTTIAKRTLKDEVLELKQQSGKAIFVGSRSLIIQLMKHNLIDELQLCIYPVIEGNGLQLFEDLNSRIQLKLIDTKVFTGGAIILFYEPLLTTTAH